MGAPQQYLYAKSNTFGKELSYSKNLTSYLANIIMLGKSSPSQKKLAKEAREKARKRNPKAYFHAIKRLTKWSKQSLIAISFATSTTSPTPVNF